MSTTVWSPVIVAEQPLHSGPQWYVVCPKYAAPVIARLSPCIAHALNLRCVWDVNPRPVRTGARAMMGGSVCGE